MDALDRWESWAAILFGVAGIALGIGFRFGRFRGLARYYQRRRLPFYVRNLAFGMIPFGLLFSDWFVLFVLAEVGRDVAGAVVGYGSFAFFFLGLWWTIRPPEFLKPEWMRKGDRWDER